MPSRELPNRPGPEQKQASTEEFDTKKLNDIFKGLAAYYLQGQSWAEYKKLETEAEEQLRQAVDRALAARLPALEIQAALYDIEHVLGGLRDQGQLDRRAAGEFLLLTRQIRDSERLTNLINQQSHP